MMTRYAFLILCLIAGPACATVRTVTTTTDDVNDTGSLRYWVANADAGDTITFDLASYPAVIQLTNYDPYPQLRITKSLTIVGPGADKLTIEAAVDGEGGVQTAIGITQPDVPTADIDVSISGLRIDNAATSIFTNAEAGATGFKTHVDISDVLVTPYFEAFEFDGGVIATVTRVTATGGGDTAVYTLPDGAGSPSVVTISDSTISNNSGAVNNNGSNITIINSTLAANGCPTPSDSCAEVLGYANSTTTFVFTTIAGSAAIATRGIFAPDLDPSATFTLKNSLIAGHAAGNCSANAISSSDYNLSDDATCALDGTHDLNNTSAGLDANGLAFNGGPTKTIALAGTSAALNAIPAANCTDTADNPVATDQRGAARPDGSGCDIGAYESDAIFRGSFE